jgi:type IV pilus assembly protein PilW
MTLVELMVAMTIGLAITLAVTSMLIVSENHKRATTSTNDAEQTGAYAFYSLDRILRGAGSAFAESAYPVDRGVLGCTLTGPGTMPLPRTAVFPTPFNKTTFLGGSPGNLRVAPLLIDPGQSSGGSDVIIVMSGSGSAGAVPRQVTGGGSATSLVLDSAVGFSGGDIALVSQNGVPACLLEQVGGTGAVTTSTLPLPTTAAYHTTGSGTTLATLAGSPTTYVSSLGNASANNIQFLMFGVDANRTLYSYDILQNAKLVQGGADVAQPVADGVAAMYAIYGIDTDGDGFQNTWAAPSEAGFDVVSVMGSPATMRKIVSVRVALVMRGEYYDKTKQTLATATNLTLFAGLTDTVTGASMAQTVSLSVSDQSYRYRVFEFTVPLRNMLLLAGASAP